ncbi:hypothetical protein H696_05732 [Fonticula alba]|uniref:SH3 domain-containing protein n=1 Tax=Fonticula alba TaxID=691883 RepID=A0A058Z0K6_FONAL|nr:hypothetical protein H696_05732 [Fonticula alba]KCV67790.1 hypothetical protein H696_05732 [Fonticula alba]|eukprot:XP_009497821.1 hypothetical protein H696_05732 [Fonticula alba]
MTATPASASSFGGLQAKHASEVALAEEIRSFLKRRSEIELQYSNDLSRLANQALELRRRATGFDIDRPSSVAFLELLEHEKNSARRRGLFAENLSSAASTSGSAGASVTGDDGVSSVLVVQPVGGLKSQIDAHKRRWARGSEWLQRHHVTLQNLCSDVSSSKANYENLVRTASRVTQKYNDELASNASSEESTSAAAAMFRRISGVGDVKRRLDTSRRRQRTARTEAQTARNDYVLATRGLARAQSVFDTNALGLIMQAIDGPFFEQLSQHLCSYAELQLLNCRETTSYMEGFLQTAQYAASRPVDRDLFLGECVPIFPVAMPAAAAVEQAITAAGGDPTLVSVSAWFDEGVERAVGGPSPAAVALGRLEFAQADSEARAGSSGPGSAAATGEGTLLDVSTSGDLERLFFDDLSRVGLSRRAAEVEGHLSRVTVDLEKRRKEFDAVQSLASAYRATPQFGSTQETGAEAEQAALSLALLEVESAPWRTALQLLHGAGIVADAGAMADAGAGAGAGVPSLGGGSGITVSGGPTGFGSGPNSSVGRPAGAPGPGAASARPPQVRVLYTYEARAADELSANEGDLLTVASDDDPTDADWIRVLPAGAGPGTPSVVFPRSYVEPAPAGSPSAGGISSSASTYSLSGQQGSLDFSGHPLGLCQRVRAVHSYSAQDDTELTLAPGDVIEIISRPDPDWWYGLHTRTSKEGYFSVTIVEAVSLSGGVLESPVGATDGSSGSGSSSSASMASLMTQPSSGAVSRSASTSSSGVGAGGEGDVVQAIYPYSAAVAGELSFAKYDMITVTSRDTGDESWWEGRLADGSVGQFPCAYVRVPKASRRSSSRPVSTMSMNFTPPASGPPSVTSSRSASSSAAAAAPAGKTATVQFDYEAREAGELSVAAGSVVTLIPDGMGPDPSIMSDENWTYVRDSAGRTGLIPTAWI